MEEALSAKMKEFMTTMDQVKKSKALLAALIDFAIIIALTLVAWQTGNITSKLGAVFIEDYGPVSFLSLLQLFLIVFGMVFAVYWVNRKVKAVKVDQWKGTLEEGPPGAIKLLQEINWEETYRDIRYAKIGFALFGFARIFAFWFGVSFFFMYAGGFFLNLVLHVDSSVFVITLNLMALAIVLYLSRKDLQRRFDQIGRLDSLMWELRWLDNELRRADFKT